MTFSSRCPPDFQPNTRVLALCGITDYDGLLTMPSDDEEEEDVAEQSARSKTGAIKDTIGLAFSKSKRKERKERKALGKTKATGQQGLAGPKKCGWFFSDFYLFHHLFQGVGTNQIWMTSEDPHDLVRRYGSYAHGEATGDHRVVLDNKLLPQIQAPSNLRVCKRAELKEDFLRTLRDEARTASVSGQPLLLLLFGHGDPGTYGIAVGGNGTPRTAPRLQTNDVAIAIGGLNVSISVMLTSCYSGGWVFQPQLNITALAAAGPKVESQAWGNSLGGRHHGSVWASAVKDSFVKMEDERATQYNPFPAGKAPEQDDGSSTFAELGSIIHDTLLHEVDVSLGHTHEICFAAQDDRWADEWRQRSGIPLARFKAQWDKLERLPPQQEGPVRGARRTGGVVEDIGSMSLNQLQRAVKGPYGLHPKFNKAQAHMVVTDLATAYLSSYPGGQNTGGGRQAFDDSTRLLDGEHLDDWETAELQSALTYRLHVTKLATEYKDMLELAFPDCNLVDVEEWEMQAENRGQGPASPPSGKGKGRKSAFNRTWALYDAFRDIVLSSKVFPEPVGDQGWSYTKPWRYLSAAFVDSNFDEGAAKEAVAKLIAICNKRIKALTQRIRYDGTVRRFAEKAFNSTGKRMRSPSPRKRGPIASFDEVLAA
ncbi:MAG: hypothetical protein Q9183_000584 [Haloplaca sp. 2 TL-2023]